MSNPIKAILKNMRVTEVSLVDEGDNPHADVVVIKRRAPDGAAALEAFAEVVAKLNALAVGEEGAEGAALAVDILKGMNIMNIEELNDKLGQIEEALDTVTKAKDAAEGRVAELEAALAAKDEEIGKLRETGAGEGEDDVLKGLPEPIRKRLEAAEAKAARAEEAIEKANEQRAIDAAIEKAKGFGVGDPDALGGVLFRIEKGRTTPEDLAVIEGVIAKVKAITTADSRLFTTIGKSGAGDPSDPEVQIRNAAEAIQKAKPTLSYEAAYAEALEANPRLYEEVRKARAN